MRRLDRFNVLEKGRRPLAGVAADEAVEILKAESGWPQVERPGLAAVPVGHVVVLAVPGCVVAVLPEHLGKRAAALGHERVIPRKTGASLHDESRRGRMVVTPGKQRRAGGRAERAGMELRVAQAVLGK